MLYLGVRKMLEFEPKSQNETRRERSKEDLAITNEVLIRRESAYKREEGKNNFGAKIQIGIWFDFLNGVDMHCIEKGTRNSCNLHGLIYSVMLCVNYPFASLVIE